MKKANGQIVAVHEVSMRVLRVVRLATPVSKYQWLVYTV